MKKSTNINPKNPILSQKNIYSIVSLCVQNNIEVPQSIFGNSWDEIEKDYKKLQIALKEKEQAKSRKRKER